MLRTASALAVAALAVTAGPATAAHHKHVKAPDGTYSGGRHHVFMSVSGKTIDLMAFDFPCHGVKGRTSIDDIALRKSSKGYKFSTKVHSSASYSDGRPDQNGVFAISGQFTRRAKSVSGRFQAYTRRCGATGKRDWSAAAEKSDSQPR